MRTEAGPDGVRAGSRSSVFDAGPVREQMSALRLPTPVRLFPASAPAQTQRRTFTPPTHTHWQATTGLRTTTAPRAPAQPARTTPLAQTTALASVDSKVMVAPKAKRAEAMIRK